jgi:predicted amidohydrolase
MKETIQAGIIQFAPKLGDLNYNYQKTEELLSQADEAELIVLPELSNSGYNFTSKEQAFALSETINQSDYLELLSFWARKNDQLIIAGINERDNNKLFNTAVLVGPAGLLGKYRKVHLFWNEFDFFEKGDLGFPVFEVNGFKIGVLICFDWVFPEAWRILALAGAEVICHPSNLVLPYAQQAVPVQCMMNRYFAITANRYGTEGAVTFSGRSFMCDPKGQTTFTAPPNKDTIHIESLDLSLARDKMITPRNHVLNDRMPGLYQSLTDFPE